MDRHNYLQKQRPLSHCKFSGTDLLPAHCCQQLHRHLQRNQKDYPIVCATIAPTIEALAQRIAALDSLGFVAFELDFEIIAGN